MAAPTYSYGYNPWSRSNPTGSKIDAVRLILRITSDPWELAYEEIQYIIDTQNTNNMKWIAYKAAESILGNYANQIDRTMGPLFLSDSQKFDHWMKMAEFMRKAATTNSTSTPLFAASPYEEKIFSIGFQDPHGQQYPNSGTTSGDL